MVDSIFRLVDKENVNFVYPELEYTSEETFYDILEVKIEKHAENNMS